MRLSSLALTVLLSSACLPDSSLTQDRLSTDWPDWQRIEASELPEVWRIEEASFAFDAWEASVVVTRLAMDATATTIRLEDADGNGLDVRMAPLASRGLSDALSGGLDPVLVERDAVRMQLVRRQGFEGVAQGLALREEDGQLLLLYDDGGYGPAFSADGARGGVSVDRSLRGPDTGDAWEPREVTFEFAGGSVTLDEGETARLGTTGLAVSVVVSREWTGAPPTDVDITPLAYLIYRVR